MPGAITEFAAAKINLSLRVLGRRPDGYHELDSIVAFADVGDELTITPSTEFSLRASGPFAHLLPGPRDNIIFAAWKAVAGIAPLPEVAVELVKNLPVSAGIGGGSADAAAAMRGFLRLAGLGEPDAAVMAAAAKLGADVPVCLLGKACRMQGVGERLTPLENFAPLQAVLVNPMTEVSTAAVFERLGLAKGERHATPISPSPLWGGVGVGVAPTDTTRPPPLIPPHKGEGDIKHLGNDLMSAAMAIAPVIEDVLTALESRPGVDFARMSGSGATCFGIFRDEGKAIDAARELAAFHPAWWVSRAILA